MVSEMSWAGKLAADFGTLGALIVAMVIFCRLLDKWAGKFLDAQQAQTVAMTQQAVATSKQADATVTLAATVREGQSDQREVLIAVRVLADRIEQQKRYLEQIEANCSARQGCKAA